MEARIKETIITAGNIVEAIKSAYKLETESMAMNGSSREELIEQVIEGIAVEEKGARYKEKMLAEL